jgi:carbon-monoxide dehydrogenase medium subunit
MKPAPFAYHAPRSLEEATGLLAEHGDDARILAGGQSLVPAMSFRLARPARLIDINRIDGLDGLDVAGDALRIGALARHAAFERRLADGPFGTLLPEIARHIGHLPIRVRGTFAGSLAHADPASEWCLLAATFDAEILARSQGGERIIPAADFFQGILTTALGADELIAEVRLPLPGAGWRTGFVEFSRRAGDFALAMALVALRIEDGRIAQARIGAGGAGDRPLRVPDAETALVGREPDRAAFEEAARIAAAAVDPFDDVHATADYRRDLVRVMTKRALGRAMAA